MIDTPRRTASESRERESKERTTRVVPFPGGSALDRDAIHPSPPDNIPATEAVLGNLLIQRTPEQQSNMYGRIADVIEPNDIRVDLLRRIYVAIGQHVDAGRLANPITLQSVFSSEEFVRPGETVHQYLGSLGAHQAVASADAIEFAHAVRECAVRRQVIYVCETARDEGHRNSFPVQEQLEELAVRIESLATERRGHSSLTPTSYACPDEATLPRRPMIYGTHEERGNVGAMVAIPGIGKTTMAVTELLAKATGRQLLHDRPSGRLCCWFWTGEEKRAEMDLRFAAAMRYHNIDPADLRDRLFVDTGREQKLVTATSGRDGVIIARPALKALVRAIKNRGIDSLTVDPFVKSHRVPENDNTAMDEILSEWADVADQTNCAVTLVAHPRKTGGARVMAEDMRGGSSQIGAVRAARVLNKMTDDEAGNAAVEEPWRHIRVDDGKGNNAPPGKARWVRLESIQLLNGENVGVASTWEWPDPFANVSVSDLQAVQKAVEGGRWRKNPQAEEWVGRAVAQALGLNVERKGDRSRIGAMLKAWIANGALIVVTGPDERRRQKSFVKVGRSAD